MATGESTKGTDIATEHEGLLSALEGEERVTILACPAPRQVIAAAIVAAISTAPVHVRVLGHDRGTIETGEGLTVGTMPGLAPVDAVLSPYTPLSDALAVADAIGRDTMAVDPTVEAIRAVGSDPAPGIAATTEDIATTLETSTLVHSSLSGEPAESIADRLDAAGLPRSVEDIRADESGGRRLGTWLCTLILDEQTVPSSVATALESALAPTYVDHELAPTGEGLHEVLGLVTEARPGLVVSALLGGDSWASVHAVYRELAETVHTQVDRLPTDAGGDHLVATTTEEEEGLLATVRLWTGYRLHAPYGLLIRDGSPSLLALASTGERSAGAVLETVANRNEGVCWGDERTAGALLDAPGETITAHVREAL